MLYLGLCNDLPLDVKNFGSIGKFERVMKKVSDISDSFTAIMKNRELIITLSRKFVLLLRKVSPEP